MRKFSSVLLDAKPNLHAAHYRMPSKVSIVVPLYNRAEFICQTVASVQAQTCPDWELIIVDDGSTDGSLNLAKKLADSDNRIRVLERSRPPKGAPACRNIGAANATGEFLIFLDSDDLLAPFCVERRVNTFASHVDCDFLVFPMLLFVDKPYDGDILWNIDLPEDDLERFLRLDAVWQTTCPIYKKNYFLQFGLFNEQLSFRQDFELHVRLLIDSSPLYKKFLHLEPDCFLRRHKGGSISQNPDDRWEEKLAADSQIYHSIGRRLYATRMTKRSTLMAYSATELFKVSHKWIRKGSRLRKAMTIWNEVARMKLISRPSFLCAAIYLIIEQLRVSVHSRLVSSISNFYYRQIFPQSLKPKRRTLCKVNYKS